MTARALTGLVLVTTLVLAGCAGDRDAGPELLIPINALCTTCNDFIRCDGPAEPGAPVEGGDFDLLHLKPKPVLAQMATIFDFLLQAFRERQEDRRPLAVYSSGRRGVEPQAGAEAITDLVRHRIAVPDGWIDQASGAWRAVDDSVRGQCRLLPVAEGRALAERLRQGESRWRAPAEDGRPKPGEPNEQ